MAKAQISDEERRDNVFPLGSADSLGQLYDQPKQEAQKRDKFGRFVAATKLIHIGPARR